MNKKILVFILLCLILCGCDSADNRDGGGIFSNFGPKLVDTEIMNKDFTATLNNGEYASGEITFNVNYASFLESNTIYNNDIALFGTALCNDLDEEWSTKLDGIEYGEVEDKTLIYKEVGFKDVSIIDLKDNQYEVDQYDTAKFALGHYPIINNKTKYDVVIVNVCMTNASEEWISNLDVGAEADNYDLYYGDNHPEWLNKNNHKGFDVAANRVTTYVNNYLSDKVENDANIILFITGYSRGAAIANILAANYTDLDKYKVFGYSYETPNTVCTEEDIESNYKNIFNICSSRDIISKVPLESWGFKRYGLDIIREVNGETYKELTGADFYQTKESDFVNINLLNCTRKEIYDKEIVLFDNLKVNNGDETICKSYYDSFKESIEKLNKKEMFKMSEIECVEGKYNFTITGSLACFIEVVSYFIPNMDSFDISTIVELLGYLNMFNYYLPVVSDILNIVGFSFDTIELTNPHFLLSTVAIIKDYK